MKSRANTILAGLALTVPFLVPTIGAAQEFEPVVYVSSTTSGNVDGVSFADEDILAYNVFSDSWEKYFDGSDVGLRGNDVNAFHIEDDGTILVTLKRPQRVAGFWADDSDVIAFSPTSLGGDTAGTFSKYFDGSDVGLSTDAEEVDALARTPDGRLLLSTSGPHKVPRTGGGTLRGADEDLIVFNATSLGTKTGGSFERYFDGSDVGLRNSSEDIWGAWVEPNTGEIVLTTKARYWVPGLNGDKEDVIVFVPTSLGTNTTGTFYLGWDGDDHGLSGEYLDGLSVRMVPASQDPPQFQASLTNDWVQGWNFAPSSTVTVEIFDGVGGASQFFSDSVPTDDSGYFNLYDLQGVDLVPGTYIVVTGSEKTLEMVDLTFDVFDPAADLIEGTADPGTIVGFGVGNEFEGFGGEVTADIDGNWSVDLSAVFDLTPQMGGQAYVTDDDGDQTVAEPRFPQFQAWLTNDWIDGWNFTPDASVVVEIFDGVGGTSLFVSDPIGTDSYGNFNLEPQEGVDLVPGTYIVVTGSEKTLEMVDLTFDTFDFDSDRIGGTAPVGAIVEFGVGNEFGGVGGQIVATDGTWSVDLNTPEYGNFDLTAAVGGQASVADEDGDRTVAEQPPFPQFQASLTNDWVQGWNFTPSSTVTVEIFDGVGGTSQFVSDPIGTDSYGNFNLEPQEGVDLVPGTYIVVTGSEKTLEMVDLTFDTFDFDSDRIGGTAPVGALVEFGVGNEFGGVGGQIVATDGTWSVDLNTPEYGNFDLTAAVGGQASVADEDGDRTVAEQPPFPRFQASLTNDWVQGWNFTPSSTVTVEIFDGVGGTSQFFSDSVPTDDSGYFYLDDLQGVDLVPGTYIVVTGSEKTLEMVAVTFDTFDFDSDRIGGTAPVGAIVEFYVGNEFDGFGGLTLADGTGQWSVDLSGQFDITDDVSGQAWVNDEDGDQTVADSPPLVT